jgi:hypothetical protein
MLALVLCRDVGIRRAGGVVVLLVSSAGRSSCWRSCWCHRGRVDHGCVRRGRICRGRVRRSRVRCGRVCHGGGSLRCCHVGVHRAGVVVPFICRVVVAPITISTTVKV